MVETIAMGYRRRRRGGESGGGEVVEESEKTTDRVGPDRAGFL